MGNSLRKTKDDPLEKAKKAREVERRKTLKAKRASKMHTKEWDPSGDSEQGPEILDPGHTVGWKGNISDAIATDDNPSAEKRVAARRKSKMKRVSMVQKQDDKRRQSQMMTGGLATLSETEVQNQGLASLQEQSLPPPDMPPPAFKAVQPEPQIDAKALARAKKKAEKERRSMLKQKRTSQLHTKEWDPSGDAEQGPEIVDPGHTVGWKGNISDNVIVEKKADNRRKSKLKRSSMMPPLTAGAGATDMPPPPKFRPSMKPNPLHQDGIETRKNSDGSSKQSGADFYKTKNLQRKLSRQGSKELGRRSPSSTKGAGAGAGALVGAANTADEPQSATL